MSILALLTCQKMVVSNGSIINVSQSSAPDLYFALRGGSGSNFGIVTRFDLFTFEQGPFWGGLRIYDMAKKTDLVRFFYNFVNNAPTDDYAHNYIGFSYLADSKTFYGVSAPFHGKAEDNPPIFKELDAITSISDVTMVANMSTHALSFMQDVWKRQLLKTMTFKNYAEAPGLMGRMVDYFHEESLFLIKKNVTGFLSFLAFQPISLNIIK